MGNIYFPINSHFRIAFCISLPVLTPEVSFKFPTNQIHASKMFTALQKKQGIFFKEEEALNPVSFVFWPPWASHTCRVMAWHANRSLKALLHRTAGNQEGGEQIDTLI